MNTEAFDPDGIVTLSSNQFTLQAGSYFINAMAPAQSVVNHQLRLRNITDSNNALLDLLLMQVNLLETQQMIMIMLFLKEE